MDRRDRRECAGLVRARTETGLVAPARGGRIPGLPSRDHALLRGCRGRGRGPDRSVWPPAATVGASGDGARTALALGRHVRHGDRRESPVPRLAGILRFATVPALERAVVLRRLGRDRRSLLLGGAARGARVGRPATLGTRARVPRHTPWRYDAGVVARPRPRRVVGAAGAGGVRGGRRGGLDPALVRRGGPAPGGDLWAGGARRVRRRERRGEPRGQGADSHRRGTAVRPRRPVGGAHHRGATLPLGGAHRFAGQRRGTRVGRRSAPRPPRGARGAHHLAGPGDRAIRAVPCGGGGFEQRRYPRIAVGCALPRTRFGRRRLGDGAGPAPLMRLDWAAR